MRAHFTRHYGQGPLHLLALIGALLVTAAAVVGIFDSFQGPAVLSILKWFVGAIVAHDLVALPLYTLLDRIAFGRFIGSRDAVALAPERPAGAVYVRVPVLLSGLIFLVFFPEILGLGDSTFHAASGLHQHIYLVRYLVTAGAIFALSALAYAASLRRRQFG